MKETKRALRRHHRQRMIQHALNRDAAAHIFWGDDDESRAYRRKRALRLHDNLKACSCFLCGNPRRFEGQVTVQERRHQEAARYELRINGR